MTDDHHCCDNKGTNLSQWIVSLAISVVCCAGLFVVFAVYIMDLHKDSMRLSLRMDDLKDKQVMLSNEVDVLRHPAGMPAPMGLMAPPAQAVPSSTDATAAQAPAVPPAPTAIGDKPALPSAQPVKP